MSLKRLLKIVLRIVAWLLASLLLCLVLILLLIQTKPVQQKIARIAENQVNSILNAKLSIGELDGNFWDHLTLRDVLISQNADSVLAVDELTLNYRLRPLLHQQIDIQSVAIVKPKVFLKQNQDSIWNVTTLVKETETETEADSTSTFNWAIELGQLELTNGGLQIQSLDTLIPQQISNLNILLSGFYSAGQQQLKLQKLDFNTEHPDFQLQQLAFNIQASGDNIELSDFIVQTSQNKLNAEAEYRDSSQKESTASLETAPLQLNEFSFVLPDFKMAINPSLDIQASLQQSVLQSTISLVSNEQRMQLKLEVHELKKFIFNPDSTRLKYQLNADFQNIKLADWTGSESLDYLLNGQADLQGEGTTLDDLAAQLKLQISNSNIAGYQLNDLSAQADFANKKLNSTIEMHADFGEIDAKLSASELRSRPQFVTTINTRSLNLAPLLDNDSLQSNINIRAHAAGSGLELPKLSAKGELELSPSEVMGVPLDSAQAHIAFEREIVSIDTLFFYNKSLSIRAGGQYNLKGESVINLNGEISSLNDFAPLLPEASIAGSGNFEAQLNGPVDQLAFAAKVKLDEARYNEFSIEKAQLRTEGQLDSTMQMTGQIRIDNFHSDIISLDSIRVQTELNKQSAHVRLGLGNKELNSFLTTNIDWSQPTIEGKINEWELNYKNQNWKLAQSTEVKIDSMNYWINDFNLQAEGNQSIRIDGLISRSDSENFNMSINNFDVGSLLQTFNQDPIVSGKLNFELALGGEPDQLELQSQFNLQDASVSNFNLTKTAGELTFRDNQLQLNTDFKIEEGGQIAAQAEIPMQFSLKTFASEVSATSPLNGSIAIEKIPLALIQAFVPAKTITGQINGDFKLDGTLEKPIPTGSLRLDDGSIDMPEYGVEYTAMTLKTEFDSDVIKLDTLGIRSADGTITGSGQVFFESEFYKGKIKQSTLNIKFDKFNPINHKQINMQLSGGIDLNTENSELVFDGDLEIPQSEIYLPAMLQMMGKVYTPEIPQSILERELEKMESQPDSLTDNYQTIQFSDSINSAYFTSLTGRIKIKIPKNMWIKNPDMRMELEGDLELIKNESFSELFGSINIVRGQYDLFGRTFVIDEGAISFEGGEEMLPTVNLTAVYTIKNNDSESKELKLFVEGKVDKPSISFTLDDQQIDEGDAISYIVFGKGLNELNASDQDDISGASREAMAKNAAANLLASQLTKVLGENLNVDYIKIRSEDEFDNASLEVGKYITNDLFVSYQQQFGATTDNDLSRYEVKLEYEIIRFLFLQLNNSTNDSGFDVIFKLRAE